MWFLVQSVKKSVFIINDWKIETSLETTQNEKLECITKQPRSETKLFGILRFQKLISRGKK